MKMLGGAFGLELPDCSLTSVEPPFAGPHTQFFLSVRCALKALCEVHHPPSAWLPSYVCASLLEPFEICGVTVRYYPINQQLQCANETFLDDIQPGDFLLVIHYFGFPFSSTLAEKAHSQGALIIEDASQALFLKQQFFGSTCILYSPRKFLGIPDGAVMVSVRATGTAGAPLTEPPRDWWKLAVAMSLKRREQDLTGIPNDWFSLFRKVECHMPVGSYRASDLSLMLLLQGINYATIRARRRANYTRLLEQLPAHALFPKLEENIVPLGFPVHVSRPIRDGVLLQLHQQKIFAPQHWPIEQLVPPSFRDSHRLAQSSLTLLCDQRYQLEDIDRQAHEFERALAADQSNP